MQLTSYTEYDVQWITTKLCIYTTQTHRHVTINYKCTPHRQSTCHTLLIIKLLSQHINVLNRESGGVEAGVLCAATWCLLLSARPNLDHLHFSHWLCLCHTTVTLNHCVWLPVQCITSRQEHCYKLSANILVLLLLNIVLISIPMSLIDWLIKTFFTPM